MRGIVLTRIQCLPIIGLPFALVGLPPDYRRSVLVKLPEFNRGKDLAYLSDEGVR